MRLDQMDYLFVRVTHIESYGIFVCGQNFKGLIHISEVTDGWCDDIYEYAEEGDILLVHVLETDDPLRCNFSLKSVPARKYTEWKVVAEQQFGKLCFEARVRESEEGTVRISFGEPEFYAVLNTKDSTPDELDDVAIELSGYDQEKHCFVAEEKNIGENSSPRISRGEQNQTQADDFKQRMKALGVQIYETKGSYVTENAKIRAQNNKKSFWTGAPKTSVEIGKIDTLRKKNRNKKVLFIGGTGVGKSSIINALLELNGANQYQKAKTGAIDPETQQLTEYQAQGFNYWDSPGLGESLESDEKHMGQINSWLDSNRYNRPIIVVVLDANSRDYATEFSMLDKIYLPYETKILYVINQVDVMFREKLFKRYLCTVNVHRDSLAKTELQFINAVERKMTTKKASVEKRLSEHLKKEIKCILLSAGFDSSFETLSPWNIRVLQSELSR